MLLNVDLHIEEETGSQNHCEVCLLSILNLLALLRTWPDFTRMTRLRENLDFLSEVQAELPFWLGG